jgi:Lon-like ATP-dependent protease
LLPEKKEELVLPQVGEPLPPQYLNTTGVQPIPAVSAFTPPAGAITLPNLGKTVPTGPGSETVQGEKATAVNPQAAVAAKPKAQVVVPVLKFGGDNPNLMQELVEYLGNPVFDESYERAMKAKRVIGNVNVLTVSGFVGNVLNAECVFDISHAEKKGTFSASGNLKKVLQESLTIAKINAMRFLNADQLKFVSEQNIHIHFMHGSAPKDGPSAGISICTAYLSLILNKPVPSNLAMTGELSLNGEVWKIGGVQAKVTASKALDITRIILPFGNLSDYLELSKQLHYGLTVYFVKEYKQVYDIAFGEAKQDWSGRIDMVRDGVYIRATTLDQQLTEGVPQPQVSTPAQVQAKGV